MRRASLISVMKTFWKKHMLHGKADDRLARLKRLQAGHMSLQEQQHFASDILTALTARGECFARRYCWSNRAWSSAAFEKRVEFALDSVMDARVCAARAFVAKGAVADLHKARLPELVASLNAGRSYLEM